MSGLNFEMSSEERAWFYVRVRGICLAEVGLLWACEVSVLKKKNNNPIKRKFVRSHSDSSSCSLQMVSLKFC